MSILSKEDFCSGSVKGTVEDCENNISISFEVFIPKQEYSYSDDDFEIYLDDTYDKDYDGEWSNNLENCIYDSCFLGTICDYAFAVRNKGNETIYTDNSCKVYIEESDIEWDVKASENDTYFVSVNTYGADGLKQLLTKSEKLEEIEEIAKDIGELFDNDIISYENFASHILDAMEQDFISDDDINCFDTTDIIEESARWFILYFDCLKLNDLKNQIANALNINLYDNSADEELLEDMMLRYFDTEDSTISEDVNNFDIDFTTSVRILTTVIDNEYSKKCTIMDW